MLIENLEETWRPEIAFAAFWKYYQTNVFITPRAESAPATFPSGKERKMITRIAVVDETKNGLPQELFYDALKRAFPSMPKLREARTRDLDDYYERFGDGSPHPELYFDREGHLTLFRTATSDRPIKLVWAEAQGEFKIRSISIDFPGGSWNAARKVLEACERGVFDSVHEAIVTLSDGSLVSRHSALRLLDEVSLILGASLVQTPEQHEFLRRWFEFYPWDKDESFYRRRCISTLFRKALDREAEQAECERKHDAVVQSLNELRELLMGDSAFGIMETELTTVEV